MKKIFYTSVFLVFAAFAYSQNTDSLITALKSEISTELKKTKSVGISYAILHADSVFLEGNAGFASIENKIVSTSKTVYRVGSVSKIFTAIAVMQLHEQGKLNIDISLSKQLPGFAIQMDAGKLDDITPRMLLTHHSGLPSDFYCNMFSADSVAPAYLLSELPKTYNTYLPNQMYAYSNVGYGLLGLLVEHTSGMKFEKYMQEFVFSPMEMKNSSFEEPENIKPLLASGYKGTKLYKEGFIRDIGAGMMVSNVEDMLHFMQMIMNRGNYKGKQILKPEALAEMIRTQNAGNEYDSGKELGLCFHLNDEPLLKEAGLVFGHGGDTEVFHASVTFVPEYKLASVVLTNSDKGAALRSKYNDLMLAKCIKEIYGFQLFKEEKNWQEITTTPTLNLNDFAGIYATPLGLMKFNVKNNYLKTSIQGLKLKLYENTSGNLTSKISLMGIPLPKMPDVFSIKIIGNDTLMYQEDNILGLKYTPTPIHTAWKNAVGKYELLNKGNNIFVPENMYIGMNDNILEAKFTMVGSKMGRVLHTTSDERAIAIGRGRSMNDSFHLINEDGKTFLWYSGYKYKMIAK